MSLIAAVSAVMTGCKKKEEIKDTRTPIEKRMQDPVYLKELDKVKVEQKKIVQELQALRIKAKVASEKDPKGESAEVKALKDAELKCIQKLEQTRLKVNAMIRERMLQDTDLNKKKETK
jgi:hypothetical protein